MRPRPVIPREQALRDIDEALAYHLAEATATKASGFIDALARAWAHVARYPATGAARYAHELNLPGVRCRRLKRHPFVVFYVAHDTHIDVWRLLHGKRDIPARLQEDIPNDRA